MIATSMKCTAPQTPHRGVRLNAARPGSMLRPPTPSFGRHRELAAQCRRSNAPKGRSMPAVQSFFWGNNQQQEEEEYYDDGRVTVCKVQVGLLGSARQIQKDLERMAEQADTDSPEGLHFILQETVLALMRNPEYCMYAYSTGACMGDPDRAEQKFNEFSFEERTKFESETLVNVGGRARRAEGKKSSGLGGVQELIVVTILVAAEGSFKLPKITSRGELRTAMSRLGALREDDILAVEVLWTPEGEDDYFSLQDLATDYPLLNTL